MSLINPSVTTKNNMNIVVTTVHGECTDFI